MNIVHDIQEPKISIK